MAKISLDERVRMKFGLTQKMEAFGRHYVANGYNGRQAAISAGYSKRSALEIAYENLRKPKIITFIEYLEKPNFEELKLDENWVITKLKAVADSKITDFIEIKNNRIQLKDFSSLTSTQVSAVKSIKKTSVGLDIKLFNKNVALTGIAKHLGMFKNRITQPPNNENTTRVYIIPCFGSNE